jgi:hypothetical protein
VGVGVVAVPDPDCGGCAYSVGLLYGLVVVPVPAPDSPAPPLVALFGILGLAWLLPGAVVGAPVTEKGPKNEVPWNGSVGAVQSPQ